jgi:hypothetical protein
MAAEVDKKKRRGKMRHWLFVIGAWCSHQKERGAAIRPGTFNFN